MASTGSGGPANAVEKKAGPPTQPHVQKPPPPPARKEPPPEKPSDIRRRTWVILSFWLVVVCLGLPIWWCTTAIYRASLPLEKMLQWADNKACRPVVPLQISILAPAGMPEHEASGLLRLTQHALDDLSDFDGHHLRLQLAPRERGAASSAETAREKGEDEEDGDIALRIRLAPGDANAAAMDPHAPVLNISYAPNSVPSSTATWSPLSSYIANQLREIFAEEVGVITYMLSTAAAGTAGTASTTTTTTTSNTRIPGLTPDAFSAIARRTTRTLRYAATYHLTFSLFTAGAVPNTWDVEAAITEYVRPVLDVLSPIHNFTIDTQIQLYAGPGTQAQVLSKDDLASFINAAEWPLSPSIGGAPTVNFVLFVGNQTIGLAEEGREDADGETAAAAPPSSSSSQSWLIPQWGTVYLLPPPGPDGAPHLPADALKQPMLTFAGHLLSLLGTPRSGTVPMRLATLSRIRSTDLFLRASSTLGSLARLAKALPSISIPSSVADGTAATMARLELACKSLGKPEGLRHARVADEEAEKAFFEKSMVGQLYFPDEHKIAVYLPLLGPVGVPLIIGLLNEIRGWRKRRRQRAEDGAAKKLQ